MRSNSCMALLMIIAGTALADPPTPGGGNTNEAPAIVTNSVPESTTYVFKVAYTNQSGTGSGQMTLADRPIQDHQFAFWIEDWIDTNSFYLTEGDYHALCPITSTNLTERSSWEVWGFYQWDLVETNSTTVEMTLNFVDQVVTNN